MTYSIYVDIDKSDYRTMTGLFNKYSTKRWAIHMTIIDFNLYNIDQLKYLEKTKDIENCCKKKWDRTLHYQWTLSH